MPDLIPDPAVLRRAYEAAQRLAELLEMVGMDDAAVFLALRKLPG